MDYHFVDNVSEQLLSATADAWRAQIDANPENTNRAYYEARLAHFVKGRESGVSALAGVVYDDEGFASALINVTYAKNSHLKMLDVTVRPDLNVADQEPNIPALAWIAATAITGCLNMTYRQFPCNELKVYASWPLDKEFLTAVTTAMAGDENFGSLFAVSSHGNWIVLTKKVAKV